MLYRCPDCGAEVVSRLPRKLHPAVLPSDYQQTIDALRADLARVREERGKLRKELNGRWLPYPKNKPERKYEWMLLTIETEPGVRETIIGHRYYGDWRDRMGNIIPDGQVCATCPLPEPYKAVEDEE
jgi:hypothetical protein